jgi:hypothetical protein
MEMNFEHPPCTVVNARHESMTRFSLGELFRGWWRIALQIDGKTIVDVKLPGDRNVATVLLVRFAGR